MDLDSLISETSGWLSGTGAESDVVVSSRIRLARNLARFPFLSRAEDETRSEVEQSLRSVVGQIVHQRYAEESRETVAESTELPENYVDVDAITELDQQFLRERQLISRELCEASGPRGVVIGNHQQTSVMINEEDHLRLQVLRSGFNLDECWSEIDSLDNEIDTQIEYAFHEQFGYLTACPTNVGTGIRVSVMLHLPALVQTREIQKVYQAMQKMSLAVRGLYGEGSQAVGDFYQISNQVTLGKSELEVLDMVRDVVPNIIDYERRVRKALVDENTQGLHDQVSRAYGILRNAHTISSEETMQLLSSLRMGVNLGLIDSPKIALANELLIHSQSGHLQKRLDQELSQTDRNNVRADYLRRKLADTEEAE